MPLTLWLLDESALTQISEWVFGDHGRQSCDAPAAHCHDDLAAGGGVADVAAELVVQLTHADLTLQRLLMWRHEAQCRRHIGSVAKFGVLLCPGGRGSEFPRSPFAKSS
jgi:hypothetical protein